MKTPRSLNRRHFLQTVAATAATVSILPRHVLGGPGFVAPSDLLVIAGVGVGGMGRVYLENVATENIAVLCDVDPTFAAPVYATYPAAKTYTDFRRMFDQETGIDAVVIGTPDHTHAVIALAALQRGKHVYCAKPLTRTIHESRRLLEATRTAGVATQMSTQGQAEEGPRRLREMIGAGAIGGIHAVHIWSDRPIWPQGITRPAETMAVPPGLDWDLWLGPASYRPYHEAYHPFRFRGWLDFGTGALGDMGCHSFDPVFRALELSAPTAVHASSTKMLGETFPAASTVHYDFPVRGEKPPVRLTWYDGGLKPARPHELSPMQELAGDGILFEGEKGKILCGFTGQNPRLLPDSEMAHYQPPPQTLAPSIGHYNEWVAACKGGEPAPCRFEWGAPLTEIVLLGNIALQTGRSLQWDSRQARFTNDEMANAMIEAPYREGWTL
ncbi:MAG: Gfo/Idh/MocA family oxidoreductase [Rhodothermales bacterium]|nr:Gfo/Idh/MocA family oxidoreductase [Rhodothermales bacterium]